MAYDLKAVGNYGDGADTYDAPKAQQFNSYGQVKSISANTVVIDTDKQTAGEYRTFTAGNEILFHVSAMKTGNDTTYLGRYFVATITNSDVDAVNKTNTLTISKNPLDLFTAEEFATYYCQAITIPSFDTLTMGSEDVIQPIAFNTTNYIGGIVAFKVSGTFDMNGGKINLTDLGIPVASKAIRPTLTQEQSGQGLLDIQLYSGWENWMTHDRLLLNSGNGVAFIVANTINGHSNSRIGNTSSYGAAFCRGASDSVGSKPSGITNVGGATILIACDSFNSFDPKIISKYRSSSSTAGQGLARAYIACKSTVLPNDEGLYSYDTISDSSRVVNDLNIKSFGTGALGDATNLTQQLNNYAKITAISGEGYKLTYTNKTTVGLAPITSGALVMIQSAQTAKATTSTTAENVGKFRIATVLSDNGTTLTIDKSVSDIINPAVYACQIISIPQFNTFTLSTTNSATPAWNSSIGGVFAIAVKGNCTLANGRINVELKGGGIGYGSEGLKQIGNAQNKDRLPIGQGHGSVLILANKIIMNSSTRIGATYNGANFSGAGEQAGGNYAVAVTCGYRGTDYETKGGSGAAGGNGNRPGGYGSNGTGSSGQLNSGHYGSQGAHVFIVADTIEGFNLSAISTGGQGGRPLAGYGSRAGVNFADGGAGYGGGGKDNGWGASSGGYNGGGGGGAGGDPLTGGGSSGWAFIYCNSSISQTNSGLEI